MSVGVRKGEHRRDSQNKLLAINPRNEVIGDSSDRLIDTAVSYNGTVYRADNTDRIGDLADFYRSEEILVRDLEAQAETGIADPSWYERAFLFDDEGFDSTDIDYILDNADQIELAGGPLEDIGTVVRSLGKEQDYSMHPALVFDYGAINAERNYVEEEMNSLREIREYSPESLDERLTRAGLDDVTLDI